MAEDYVLQTKITADSTQFDATLKKTGKNLTSFSSEITKVTKVIGGMFAITSLTALAKSISDVSKEFSKATSNIVKGTGATGKALDDLAKSVNKAMLSGVGRSASEVGSMVADLNTRFDATGETLDRMVASFDKFASVTDTDVKTSVNTVADIMAKWNISIDDSDKLLDQLTVASQMSGASVTELSTSLAKGQSILSQFGMSLTESTALFASLKKNGVDTSVALVGMRTALANFSKDGKNAKNAFEEVSEKIKNAKTQTEALQIATETFGTRSGAEMLKVLQSSAEGAGNFAEALRKAGGALEETDRASRTSKDALDDLKATIQATFFTGGGDTKLRDMIDGIAEAIRSFDFSAIKETFSTVGIYIKGMWSQFKVLFNNLSGSIDIATGNFEVFADMIYQYLDNAYRSMQNFVNMIDAIMKGDWSVAWEYAKLIALRTIKNLEDSINNAIRLMPNLFNSVIEGYNWVLEQQDKLFLEVFHLPEKYFKSAKLPKFEGEDLIDTASIENAIEDVRKTIEEKTGKSADYSLKQLAKVEKQTKKTTKSIEADIGDLGSSAISQTEKMDSAFDGFLKAWSKQYEDLAGNWTQTFVDMANTATSAMGEMFETIGQGLVDNGIGYEDFASTAVEALAEVLKGLAAQLAALAAVNIATWNYGKAAVAAAGAAAALVAAGTLKAVASNLKQTSTAAKEATNSIDDFIKRLQNIKEQNFSQLGTFSKGQLEYSIAIKDAIKEMDKAYEEYDKIRNKYTEEDFWSHWRWGPFGSDTFDKKGYEEWRNEIKNAQKNYDNWVKKVQQANKDIIQSFTDMANTSYDTVKTNEAITNSYKDLYNSINKVAELRKELNDWDDIKYMMLLGGGSFVGDISSTVRYQYEKYYAYLETLTNNIKAQVQEMANDVYESMLSVGKDIGETFVSSIVDGVKKEDFMLSIKDYMKKQMTKLVVLTDEFSDQIANLGLKLISAMTSENTKEFEDIKNELSDLFDEAEKKALKVESVLTGVFGKTKDSTDDAKKSISELKSEMQSLYSGTLTPKTMDILGKTYWTGFYTKDLGTQTTSAIQAQKEAIEEVIHSYYESLKTVGSSMAGIFSSGFKEGLSKEDLKKSVKEWIREQLIESTVYEAYKSQLAEIGAEIAGYMANGEAGYLKQVSSQIDSLYDEMTQTLSSIDEVLDKSFEKTIDNITDSFSDLGGDIADSLISGLSDGLSEADFMQNMYNWIKKLIVQTVVYTESMKSEIESIGRTISEGLSKGFSETSLHELRRDLSYIFYSANQQMSGIDSILSSVFDGYATGTNSALKGLHVVGEAGPELVQFRGGERVYNNADTMKILSGSGEKGNTFNVTFNNLQDTSAYTMMSQLRDYNRQLAINGIL